MKKEIKFFNKLLKKMFGYKSYAEAIASYNGLVKYFNDGFYEGYFDSPIDELRFEDLHTSKERKYFAKYRTLKKILESYLNCVEAINFNYMEYKEETK